MSGILSRQKYFFLKLAALLNVVRWYNVLLVALIQYTTVLFVYDSRKTKIELMSNVQLHLIVLATAFVVASGFLLNSFYNLEKDLINRPKKTISEQIVGKRWIINTYFLSSCIGLLISIFVSRNVFTFYLIFCTAIWFYFHKLQKLPILREVSASFLSIASFVCIAIYYNIFTSFILAYATLFTIIIFTREIIKGLENHQGDKKLGYSSLAVLMGKEWTKRALLGFMALSVGIIIFLIRNTRNIEFIYIISLLGLLIAFAGIVLIQSNSSRDFSRVNYIYKWLILCGLMATILL
ncbi:MAG: UbiA family prenyltransferase [Bacteroidota bacterium]|nr:UbiA family prenyltransferase [Bacteroidota bacterium]